MAGRTDQSPAKRAKPEARGPLDSANRPSEHSVSSTSEVSERAKANRPAVLLPSIADPVATAKLDLGPFGRPPGPVNHIPWSYGVDRVTAWAVDPQRMYAYWEVTDEAVERAKAGLGSGGRSAWLNLRVYDTSGILFDGTNAHSYFDHRVERSDRQWFFAIEKPGSTAFVELGVKSQEGYFAKIVRSGRVEFPRYESEGWSEPEWLTVFADSVHHAGRGSPRAQDGLPPVRMDGAGAPPPSFAPIPLWQVLHSSLDVQEIRLQWVGGWEGVEWREAGADRWFQLGGRTEWVGPLMVTRWEAGPFTHPVEIQPPMQHAWQGGSFSYEREGVTHVVHGPWEVVIRNLQAHASGQVLGRWMVSRSWVSHSGREVKGLAPLEAKSPGASESVGFGASERVWVGASEMRLGGASEVWRLGASEVRFLGASETLFAGASQWAFGGASERLFLGASQWLLGGASERLLGGGSERAMLGGSERSLGGASERARGFGGEHQLGASERHQGAQSGLPEPIGYPKVEE